MSAPAWRIPSALAAELPDHLVAKLLKLTRAVPKMGRDGDGFDLGAREAGRIFGCQYGTAWRALELLEAAGVLMKLSAGKYAPDHKHTARWRFTDRLIRPVDKSKSGATSQSRKRDCDSRENATHSLLTSFVKNPAVGLPGGAHYEACECPRCRAAAGP